MKKPFYIIFILIFCLSLTLKFLPIQNYNFPFTTDQGRDMLDIRRIVDGKKLTLIGPTTSINGVFLGPFWYYFNVIPYVLGQGDPAFLVYWMIFWYMLAGTTIFIFFKIKNILLGLIFSILFLISPAFFYSSRYSWSANPMPYMTTFYFISLISFLNKPSPTSSIAGGLIAGLSMQIEAAFGVLFFPFLMMVHLFKRSKLKYFFMSLFVFLATLIPQVFFEFRHNFLMTKTFLNEVLGKSSILGEKFSISQTFSSHITSFMASSNNILTENFQFSLTLFLIGIIYLSFKIYKRKLATIYLNTFFLAFFFIIWAFVFYMFYHYPLKGWYLLGLHIPFLLIFGVFLTDVFSLKKFYLSIGVGLFLTAIVINIVLTQMRFIPKSTDRSSDPSNIRNEMEEIDFIYKYAKGDGFRAYNYMPSVYDFPYQYLYWWTGNKKYGYHPNVLTYMDNVPEYIIGNEKFLDKKRESNNSDLIFLIIEPDENSERRAAWLGNYVKYCLKENKILDWKTEIQIRENCK